MTIAVSSNARKKRLSIDWGCLGARAPQGPDRIRRDGMGDTARCGGVRANYRAARHDVRALRWRTQSNSDNNGMPREAGGPALPGTPRTNRTSSVRIMCHSGDGDGVSGGRLGSCRRGIPPVELERSPDQNRQQLWKGCAIRFGADPDHDVSWHIEWQKSRSRQLSEAALDTVARNRRLAKPRNDQTDTRLCPGRKHERGSDDPNLEKDGSDALPLLRDTLQLRASCDACTSRKSERRSGASQAPAYLSGMRTVQLLPSLLAAAGKGLTTPLRFHTRTKSVRLQPPRIARTVGRLSHDYSRYGLRQNYGTDR